MRNGADPSMREALERGLRALGEERELIRHQLQQQGAPDARWAELELRAAIAVLVARKASPASQRTVDGALAAMRAFRQTLVLH